MIRAMTLVLFASAALLSADLAVSNSAMATPGMVSANGCHSRPRHCHSRGELRRNTRGRLYVPGAFGGGHRSRHRRGRRR